MSLSVIGNAQGKARFLIALFLGKNNKNSVLLMCPTQILSYMT